MRMDDRASVCWPTEPEADTGTVAQHVHDLPSHPVVTSPGRKPLNRMTQRQRAAFISEHRAKGADFRDALLSAIDGYPGGMREIQRKVRFSHPPTGGGLPELIDRLTDHRRGIVSLQFTTVRDLCKLLRDERFMEDFKGLYPDRYELGIAQEAEEGVRSRESEQRRQADRALQHAASGVIGDNSYLDRSEVAERWDSLLVQFGALSMTLGMKGGVVARAQANELVIAMSALADALGQPELANGGIDQSLASMHVALADLRNGPLAQAASGLSNELRELQAIVSAL
jgi:hypothetical protein